MSTLKTYEQTVEFRRRYEIKAHNAAEATAKLRELLQETEFHGDVEHQGYHEFEDEPVTCPKCHGDGRLSEDDEEFKECDRCEGKGEITP